MPQGSAISRTLSSRKIAVVVLGQGRWRLIKQCVFQVVATVNARHPPALPRWKFLISDRLPSREVGAKGILVDLRITCNYNTRMAPSAAPQLTMRQALAIPGFRKLWLATLVSIFGDFLALYAIFSEMTFRMHASARALTLVTVFFLLPLAFVGPVAGVFVDRWHPGGLW